MGKYRRRQSIRSGLFNLPEWEFRSIPRRRRYNPSFMRIGSRRLLPVPPLYDTVLRLPNTDIALESGLGIDVEDDIRRGTVQRAGILSSGVALHNRILERHDLPGGARRVLEKL